MDPMGISFICAQLLKLEPNLTHVRIANTIKQGDILQRCDAAASWGDITICIVLISTQNQMCQMIFNE